MLSEDLRNELASIGPESDCDRLAELSGLFHVAGSVHLRGRGEVALHLDLASAAVARRGFALLRAFGVDSEIRTYQQHAFARPTRFQLHVDGTPHAYDVLHRAGVLDGSHRPLERPPQRVLARRCCRGAYLRGALLGAGSLSGPRDPHLEIRTAEPEGARFVADVAAREGAELRVLQRRSHAVAYAKGFEAIADLLAAAGAGDTVLTLEESSVLGTLGLDVDHGDDWIQAGEHRIQFVSIKDPAELPWGDLGVDVAIESTGLFTDRASAEKHLEAGAKKVVISAPATDPDITLVLGVNGRDYDPERHNVISNASCTTNCVAPLAKILHEAYTIERGFMTTIHAYTNDQRTLDLPHKDLRRARAAAINLIPTSTGAARAIGLVLPDLKGKVDGMSMRAPVPTGSIVDLVVQVATETSADDVNELFRSKADTGELEGILQYSDEPLVSTDIVHSSYSSIFDSDLTMANGNLVKVFGWYDNEWGYSCRLVDLVAKIAETMPAAVAA